MEIELLKKHDLSLRRTPACCDCCELGLAEGEKRLDLESGEFPRELLQTKKYRLPVLHTLPQKGG